MLRKIVGLFSLCLLCAPMVAFPCSALLKLSYLEKKGIDKGLVIKNEFFAKERVFSTRKQVVKMKDGRTIHLSLSCLPKKEHYLVNSFQVRLDDKVLFDLNELPQEISKSEGIKRVVKPNPGSLVNVNIEVDTDE